IFLLCPHGALFAQSNNTCQDVLLPLYVYPSGADNRAIWTTATSDKLPTHSTRYIVINPNKGEISGWTATGNAPEISDWRWAIDQVHSGAGHGSWLAVAYIHTSNGARPLDDVEADVAAYASFFPHIDAFFVDETSADSTYTSYYTSLVSYIQDSMRFPGADIVFNVGAYPSEATLLNISHASGSNLMLGVSENDYGSVGYSPTVPSWVTHRTNGEYDYGDQHFLTLIYNLPMSSSASVVASTRRNHNGVVFVTDSTTSSGAGEQWNGVGGYWSSLISQTKHCH
ncbi:MAG: hypothetical protein J2P21_28010, partial [Chloracidobacterium sp.]|nr:hypothetical protein [Chloracidobacterium sp.]